MAAKIRREDEVIVLTGRDKGKRGKVTQVLESGKVIVEGINIVKKHQKPNPYLQIEGGIVDQEAAIDALARAIKMSRSGLGNPSKPIGCFLFSGPTGVGKTEVARQLAYSLGNAKAYLH